MTIIRRVRNDREEEMMMRRAGRDRHYHHHYYPQPQMNSYLDKGPSGESTGRYAPLMIVQIRSSEEEYASDTEQSVNYAVLKDVKALHTPEEFVLDTGPRRNVVVWKDAPINLNGRDCVDFMVHIAEE